jgi:hypothetical protein
MPGISAVSPPISAQPEARAALGDAFDDPRGGIDLQLAGGEIVEKEERLGPLADQVVDAHGDQVDADPVQMPVSMAIFSLVPTPSVAATSTGSA